MSEDRSVHAWKLLQDQFNALVRDRPDNIEDILDAEFRSRLGRLIFQATERKTRGNKGAHSSKAHRASGATGSEAP